MFGVFKLNSYFCNGIKYRLMVHVNETIVIKSSSPKMAEWVKKLKAHKAEQLEKLRNVEKCDFAFTLSWG